MQPVGSYCTDISRWTVIKRKMALKCFPAIPLQYSHLCHDVERLPNELMITDITFSSHYHTMPLKK